MDELMEEHLLRAKAAAEEGAWHEAIALARSFIKDCEERRGVPEDWIVYLDHQMEDAAATVYGVVSSDLEEVFQGIPVGHRHEDGLALMDQRRETIVTSIVTAYEAISPLSVEAVRALAQEAYDTAYDQLSDGAFDEESE